MRLVGSYFNVNPKFKWAGLFLLMVVLLAVGFWFVLVPEYIYLQELRSRETPLCEDLQLKAATAASLQQWQNQVSELRSEVEKKAVFYTPQEATPQLLYQLTELMKQYELVVREVTPEAKIPHRDFDALPVLFAFSGDYLSIVQFIAQLSQKESGVLVNEMRITRRALTTEDEASALDVSLRLNLIMKKS